MRSLISLLVLLLAAPAAAGEAASLLLRDEAAVVAACHQAPTEVRGEAARDGWRVAATDAGLHVTPPAAPARLVTTCDGLPSNRVTAVAAAPDGTWLVSALGGGVVRLRLDDAGAPTAITELAGLPPRQATAVAVRGAEVWVGTAEEGVWRWRAGGVDRSDGTADQPAGVADQPIRRLGDGLVTALGAPAGGPLYVGRGRRGLYEVALRGPAAGPSRVGAVRRVLKRRYVRRIAVDGRDVVVETPSAVCTLRVGRRRAACGGLLPDEPLPGDGPAPHVTALAVHRGRLWVGTFAHGLWTTDGATWRREDIAAAPGVLGYVNDLEERDGVLWLASPNGAARHDGRGWRVLGARDGLPAGHVNAVLPLADATWFATSRGVLRIDRRGPVLFGTAEGLPGRLVYDLAVDAEGRLLVGTNRGLARLDGGRFAVWSHEGGALSDNWVNAVAVWEDELWAGTYDAGVDRRGPDGWAPATTPQALWVNPGGLFPLDGALAVAALGDGLWARDVAGGWYAWTAPRLVPDPDVTAVATFAGRLWVATRAGLASWTAGAASAGRLAGRTQ